MPKQEVTGKAFEFACLNELRSILKGKVKVAAREDASFKNAEGMFFALCESDKNDYSLAAKKAAKLIIPLEPNLDFPDSDEELVLGIQSDKQGQSGDVRDIVCLRSKKGWEIGLSCKHNHEALKHSRLSRTIDFGKAWLGFEASKNYWNKIHPLFDALDELKNMKARWAEVERKGERFYKPLLDAFLSELNKIYSEKKAEVPQNLMRYLLGTRDFYKVITRTADRTTEVKPFNLYGGLGQSTRKRKVLSKLGVLKMPAKILSADFKEGSQNTILIYFDEGWALSLRIHSASEWVESSLKFDVQLIGVPANMGTRIEAWK